MEKSRKESGGCYEQSFGVSNLLLYIATTRAMHELTILVDQQKHSSLITVNWKDDSLFDVFEAY